MQSVDIRSRVNVSNYYAMFERLHRDTTHVHIRRGTTPLHSWNKNARTSVITNRIIDHRYPLPKQCVEDELFWKPIADAFGNAVETLVDFTIEAQRLECTPQHASAFMEARGADALLCINNNNVLTKGDFVPGHVYFDSTFDGMRAWLEDDAYDISGTFDCFLLHAHYFLWAL